MSLWRRSRAHNYGQLGQGYRNGSFTDPQGSAVPLRVPGIINPISLFGRTTSFTTTCAKTASQKILKLENTPSKMAWHNV